MWKKTKNKIFLPFQFKSQESFTLLEVIGAIFLITVGIVGVFSLITMTLSSATYSSDKLIASYLAQEGIEIVRNIRDTNWLEGGTNPWNEGLVTTDCSTGCRADYTYSSTTDPTLPPYNNEYLNIDGNGYYSYSAGTPTSFQRKITISKEEYPPASGKYDKMTVQVEVSWQEKGKPYSVPAQENLYNWR